MKGLFVNNYLVGLWVAVLLIGGASMALLIAWDSIEDTVRQEQMANERKQAPFVVSTGSLLEAGSEISLEVRVNPSFSDGYGGCAIVEGNLFREDGLLFVDTQLLGTEVASKGGQLNYKVMIYEGLVGFYVDVTYQCPGKPPQVVRTNHLFLRGQPSAEKVWQRSKPHIPRHGFLFT